MDSPVEMVRTALDQVVHSLESWELECTSHCNNLSALSRLYPVPHLATLGALTGKLHCLLVLTHQVRLQLQTHGQSLASRPTLSGPE